MWPSARSSVGRGASVKSKGRWGKLASSQKAESAKKHQAQESFQAAVRNLAAAKKKEDAAQAAIDASARELARLTAAEHAAGQAALEQAKAEGASAAEAADRERAAAQAVKEMAAEQERRALAEKAEAERAMVEAKEMRAQAERAVTQSQDALAKQQRETASVKSKGRWGKLASSQRADAARKQHQTQESFQTAVRNLAAARKKEDAAQAAIETAARELAGGLSAEAEVKMLAEKAKAEQAMTEAQELRAQAERAVNESQEALAKQHREAASVKSKGRWGKLATAQKAESAKKHQAQDSFQAAVRNLADAKKKEDAAQAAIEAAARELAGSLSAEAERKALEDKAEAEKAMAEAKEMRAQAERAISEADLRVEDHVDQDNDEAEFEQEAGDADQEEEVSTTPTLRQLVEQIKTNVQMREELNLPTQLEQDEIDAWDEVLDNSDGAADLPADFESFSATIAMVSQELAHFRHLQGATDWVSDEALSSPGHGSPGGGENISLVQTSTSELSPGRPTAGSPHSGQGSTSGSESVSHSQSDDVDVKSTKSALMRRAASRVNWAAKAKAASPSTPAVVSSKNVWEDVLRASALSTRFKRWRHFAVESADRKRAESELVAEQYQRRTTHWLLLQVVRAWCRCYRRALTGRQLIARRAAARRGRCFRDWWREHRAHHLWQQHIARRMLAVARAWRTEAVGRRNRRRAMDDVHRMRRDRLLAGWRVVHLAERFRRHELLRNGCAKLLRNAEDSVWARRVLSVWSKRTKAQTSSSQAMLRHGLRIRAGAWRAWLARHRLFQAGAALRQRTARRVAADGWAGWLKLARLAPRMSPRMLCKCSLYLPRSRKAAAWAMWIVYVRQKLRWRKEGLEEWRRTKVLERHLALGNRRKVMVVFIYWKARYINRLHSVGATTCAAHAKVKRVVRAWVAAVATAAVRRAARSLAAAQCRRTIRTKVLYALHHLAVCRRARRRASHRAEHLRRVHLGGSVLRTLRAATADWRADRAARCFSGWALLGAAARMGRGVTRRRLRNLRRDILICWSTWARFVSGRYAAEVCGSAVFFAWSRHVRCRHDARDREEWAQNALAVMPGVAGIGSSSATTTKSMLQELAVVRSIAAFRDRLVGRRVFRALRWYTARCQTWRVVVAVVLDSMRGVRGVFVRCRFLAWQAWACGLGLERAAAATSDGIARRRWTGRCQASAFKS